MRDPRVDAYINNAAPFAKPILTHLREVIHKGCPDVTETIKWNVPFFMRKRILCNMAEFKAHCAFNFWQGSKVVGKNDGKKSEAMGQFGRITTVDDLPSEKKLIAYVKESVRLDEQGAKPQRATRKAPLETPSDLLSALRKSKKAAETFQNFSPSHRREYIQWITEAKREETRVKRIAQTVQQLTEGKSMNWKYQNC